MHCRPKARAKLRRSLASQAAGIARREAAKAGAACSELVIARNELDAEERRVNERQAGSGAHGLVQLAEPTSAASRAWSRKMTRFWNVFREERAELLEENEMVQERTVSAREKVAEAATEEARTRILKSQPSDLTQAADPCPGKCQSAGSWSGLSPTAGSEPTGSIAQAQDRPEGSETISPISLKRWREQDGYCGKPRGAGTGRGGAGRRSGSGGEDAEKRNTGGTRERAGRPRSVE